MGKKRGFTISKEKSNKEHSSPVERRKQKRLGPGLKKTKSNTNWSFLEGGERKKSQCRKGETLGREGKMDSPYRLNRTFAR